MISIESAVNQFESDLVDRTLCFLIENEKVLLGFKKTGFGKGNVVGVGGGVDEGESPIQAAIREVEEEVFITPSNLKLAGVMDFYFPYVDKPNAWNQRVFVYVSHSWKGNVAESEEIAPEWHDISKIPFERMWDDNSYWLGEILSGKEVWCQFTFNQELKVESWTQHMLSANTELTSKGIGREKAALML